MKLAYIQRALNRRIYYKKLSPSSSLNIEDIQWILNDAKQIEIYELEKEQKFLNELESDCCNPNQ